MKPPESHHNTNWLDDRLEAFLDEALPDEEQRQVAQAIETDPYWQQEAELARRIQDALQAIPTPACPPAITRQIVWRARWDAFRSLFFPPSIQQAWRPALAVVTLVLVVVIALPSTPPPPPEASVEQALEEVKWTLGYVSQVGRTTGTSVQGLIPPILNTQELPEKPQ